MFTTSYDVIIVVQRCCPWGVNVWDVNVVKLSRILLNIGRGCCYCTFLVCTVQEVAFCCYKCISANVPGPTINDWIEFIFIERYMTPMILAFMGMAEVFMFCFLVLNLISYIHTYIKTKMCMYKTSFFFLHMHVCIFHLLRLGINPKLRFNQHHRAD